MNLRQEMKIRSYDKLRVFFKEFGDDLTASYGAFGPLRTEFNARFAAMMKITKDMLGHPVKTRIDRKHLKAQCREGIWKYISAMKYHYKQTNDDVGTEMVKISRANLVKLTEGNFYTFSQMVINFYNPAIYAPHGIDQDTMDALKLKFADFPTVMMAPASDSVKRKKAASDFVLMQQSMDDFLKHRVTTLINTTSDKFEEAQIRYFLALHVGIRGITSGKPHKKGKPEAGKVEVLDKQKFRNKLAIIVSNKGQTPLLAGRSTNQNQVQGTPFIIEPGKTRKRISLKLGSKGEYIVIQNLGDVAGSYEVWLKE